MAARASSVAPLPEAPTIEIDGVGRVPVPPNFDSLPLQQQNAIVDQIVAQRGGGTTAPPPAPAPGPTPQASPGLVSAADTSPIRPGETEAQWMQRVASSTGGRVVGGPSEIQEDTRGSLLPIGTTEGGNLNLAVPGFLYTPFKALMDVVNGTRTADQLTAEEVFAMGALMNPISAASGTTRQIARTADARAIPGYSGPRTPAPIPAPTPAVAEAVTPAAAEAVAPAAVSAAAPAAAPAAARGGLHSTSESLAARSEARALYRPLDDSAVTVNPASFRTVATEATEQATKIGMDETITPAANALIRRVNKAAAEPVTLQSLNTLREVANAAAGSRVPRDQAIAEQVITRLDDFVMNLRARDLVVGEEANVKAIAQSVKAARQAWSEAMRLETVARLVQRATDAAANRPSLGMENALRTEFVNLMRNDVQMRRFTQEQRDAIRQITRGPVKRTARGLGTMAPTGPVSGMASMGAVAGIGAKIGLDPVSSAIVIGPPYLAATFGARKLAEVLTQRSIRRLETLIRDRGDPGEIASRAMANGRTLAEQLSASLKTGATAEAATQPSNPDLVNTLQRGNVALGGGPPTVGGAVNLAMAALPGGPRAPRSTRGGFDAAAFRRIEEMRRELGVTANTPQGRALDEVLKAIDEALKLAPPSKVPGFWARLFGRR